MCQPKRWRKFLRSAFQGRPGVDYEAPNICDDGPSCCSNPPSGPLFIKLLLLRLKQHSRGLLKAKIKEDIDLL